VWRTRRLGRAATGLILVAGLSQLWGGGTADATDSATTAAVGLANAIDGDPQTFWHSAAAARKPLPATLTLDLGSSQQVAGLTYLPRQDRAIPGFITGYNVLVSVDGTDFTTVATGTWLPDAKLKAASWPAVTARYVRREATSGVNGVASAAEVNVASAGTG